MTPTSPDDHHNDQDMNWTALARLFAGELPEREEVALLEWIDADPARVQLAAQLRDVWERTGSLRQHWDVDAALEQIKHGHAAPASAVPHGMGARRRTVPRISGGAAPWWTDWHVLGGIAAALVLSAGATLAWREVDQSRVAPIATPAPMAEVATRRGQRATLRLADGTRVLLDVDSKLRYAQSYGSRTRDVYLAGQAFFEVVHDSTRPFAVHTARAVVRDLGTKFNVRAYPDAPSVAVTVAEGRVALSPAAMRPAGVTTPSAQSSTQHESSVTGGVVLTRAELGRVDTTGRIITEQNVDLDIQLAWLEGRLVFKNTPLREVVQELDRWYDADITIGDSALADHPITASLANVPLSQVVSLLASAMDARVEHHGASIAFVLKRSSR